MKKYDDNENKKLEKNIPKIIISNATIRKSLRENLMSKEMNSSAWNS